MFIHHLLEQFHTPAFSLFQSQPGIALSFPYLGRNY
jgi:hypothetical protein